MESFSQNFVLDGSEKKEDTRKWIVEEKKKCGKIGI
jgi:hypothetical protein